MKIDWDLVKFWSAIIAIVGVFIAVIYFSQVEQNNQRKSDMACAASCGVVKSQMINNLCHCMTDHGWDLKK